MPPLDPDLGRRPARRSTVPWLLAAMLAVGLALPAPAALGQGSVTEDWHATVPETAGDSAYSNVVNARTARR